MQQLKDGIRSFMIDFHVKKGRSWASMCHAGWQGHQGRGLFCPLGEKRASDMLRPLRQWLESNSREVITFIVEVGPASTGATAVTMAQVEEAFLSAGMQNMLYDPSATFASTGGRSALDARMFPTLGDMINSGKRIVVLTNGGSVNGRASWNLHFNSFAKESDWNYKSRAESGIVVHDSSVSCSENCAKLRGGASAGTGQVHVLNQFVTDPITSAQLSKKMNFQAVLEARTSYWKTYHGRIPNHICVDFYEIGNVFQVTDKLNGVSPRPWRCRRVGKSDWTKRYCCPSGTWWTTCSILGRCNKNAGTCSCNWGWERGFDCSKKVCRYGRKCARWSWRCWNWVPGCCGWKTFTWWC